MTRLDAPATPRIQARQPLPVFIAQVRPTALGRDLVFSCAPQSDVQARQPPTHQVRLAWPAWKWPHPAPVCSHPGTPTPAPAPATQAGKDAHGKSLWTHRITIGARLYNADCRSPCAHRIAWMGWAGFSVGALRAMEVRLL